MRPPTPLVFLATLAAATVLKTTTARGADSVFAGRIACTVEQGVRFCAGDVTTRVETWDGVPLDANVTLPPATMPPPYPLIIEEHGWSLGKTPGAFVERALAGYAVLSYTARGFHQSCGVLASRASDPSLTDPDACAHGWTHLADARYEIRDTQHLAGLLADDGWVIPTAIGVTGASYGGGRTIMLAALRNRVMLPDGSLVPWESPGGLAMEIAAGAALIPWSDLPASLVPNGSTLDYRSENPYGSRGGVRKDQWNDTLYQAGAATGFYAPPGVDPSADLTRWNERVMAGEPYDNDSASQALIDEFTRYHSGYYVDDSIPPAPLFMYNAWTDDLFPANEGLRYWLKTHAIHPDAELAVLFADDFGHPRASLGFGGGSLVPSRVSRFFDRYLMHTGDPLPVFETFTQACGDASPLGAFTSDEWDGLHPGEVTHANDEPQSFDELGGDPAVAAAVAPLAGGPCRTLTVAGDDPGAATYVLPAAEGDGYTLLGSPTIIADLVVTGAEYAQVAGRLWDVAPEGTQTLVSHGFYRPRSDNVGAQVFQLPPNGWHFAAGHAPKLELLGQSVPAGRASAGPFTVTVETLELRLPVRQQPDGGMVQAPLPHVLPPADLEPPRCPREPEVVCVPATSSSLVLAQGKRDAKDRIAWSWQSDDVVDPSGVSGDAGVTLCVWDGEGLVLSAPAPMSGTCGKKACWSASERQARYKDKKGTRTGTRSVIIQTKKDGSAAALVGGGTRLGAPSLPVASLPVVVQLLAGDGSCRGATFADARRNDERRLKALLRP